MINQNLGSYRITHLLGQGGMGAVYAAEHTLIGKRAAVKVLLPELSRDPEMVQRFFNEARSAALIRHPGLVEIFDFGYLPDGQAYLVMEFLDGESLTSRLSRDGRLPVALAAGLGAQVAGTVGTAHAHGIVHRDLKPDNLFLVPDQAVAQRIRMKVLDFGIAKLTGDSGPDSLRTRTGALIGTPLYMSPEQCRGAGAIDHRSDIYSLGVILYEMIAGARPFGGNGPGEVLAAHLFHQPPPLRAHDPNIPTAIEAVVMTCLAKDPAHRFQTMEMLGAALEASSSGAFMAPPANLPAPGPFVPTPSVPPSPGPSTTLGSSAAQIAAPPPRRRSALWLGLAAVVIAGGGGIGLWAARGGHTTIAPPTTTTTTIPTINTKPEPNPDPKPPSPADEACDPGHPEVCARLGLAYEMGQSKTRSLEAALGAYLTGCDAGSGEACAGLARLYLHGNGVRREPARALASNQKACAARSAQGCYQLGEMYVLGANFPVDHGKGLANYETACELGGVGGCMDAGIKLLYGLGVAADADKGKRLQQRALDIGPKACEAGDVFACERLGIVYFRGYGVNIDAPRAVAMFGRACELGYAMACAELGFLYQNGRGIPMDRKRAFSLLSAACDGGYNDGCAGLGTQYLRGIGVDRDEKRGLALLEGACEKGFGCGSRAQAHLNGIGGPVDRGKALAAAERGCEAGDTNACTWVGELVPAQKTEMNRRACDAGDSGGCLNLGGVLARGSADDKKRSISYFDKSCHLSGGEVGCNWLARAYLDGEGVARDEKRGLGLLDQACVRSDATSCHELALLYGRGQHVRRDDRRAAELFRQACTYGDTGACGKASVPTKPAPPKKPEPAKKVEAPRKVEPPRNPQPYRTVEPPRIGESYQPYVPTTPVRPPRGTLGDKAEVDRWLAKAKQEARAGHWSNALGAVKAVLDRDPNNQDAIAIAALSACNVRNGVAARNYLARMTGQRRALVRQVCIQNGLHVD